MAKGKQQQTLKQPNNYKNRGSRKADYRVGEKKESSMEYEIINDTIKAPYRSVCHLETERNGRTQYTSTGFFIHPKVILTAGHNLFSGVLTRISFLSITPGHNKSIEPFEYIDLNRYNCIDSIRVKPGYSFGSRPRVRRNLDLAVVILNDEALSQLKNWNYQPDFVIDNTFIPSVNDTIHTVGYPASGEVNPAFDGTIQVLDSGPILGFDDKFIRHDLITETGNSGSPVWVEQHGKRIVVGVHTFDGGATYLINENMEWLQGIIKSI